MEQTEGRTVELDVRPHLKKKLEPFQLIMDAVKKLERDDIFVLHAIFKPTPLLGVMRAKGFVNKTQKLANDHWVTTFVSQKNKHLLKNMSGIDTEENSSSPFQSNDTFEDTNRETIELDNRGLEPPQPMMRTLGALERCQPGDEVIIHNDRVPVFLIEELNNLGYPFTVDEQSDGSAKVRIQKK